MLSHFFHNPHCRCERITLLWHLQIDIVTFIKIKYREKMWRKKQNELRLYFIYRLLEALCIMCVCSIYIESVSPKRMLVMPFFLFALCVISEFLPRFSNDIDNNSLALDPLLSKSIYFFFSSVLFSVTLAIYRVKLIQVIVLLHSIIVD